MLLAQMRSVDMCNNDNISSDSLFDGELICYQHRQGYRFSIDSVLIAHFVDVRQGDCILDLGAGSGVISMILLYRWRDTVRKVTEIEVQQSLFELAIKNLQVNNLEQFGEIIQGDIKDIEKLVKPESYDRIVCNPPFYTPASGRMSKHPEIQIARHQILATLQDYLGASAFAVKNGGTVSLIYPAERICECISSAKSLRLAVKKIQFVYSYPHKTAPARLVLIQYLKNGGEGTEILPPLYVYCEKNGAFTPEIQEFYKKKYELPSKSNY